MRVVDSRRLTGPSLLLDGPGAVLDIELERAQSDPAVAAWRQELTRLLAAIGWGGARTTARVHEHGLNLAFAAPLDALYAATEVNEAAWRAAERALGTGADTDEPESFEATVQRLRDTIAAERNPWLEQLAAEASRRDLTLLSDDKRVSVGLGTGSRSWPAEATGAVRRRIPWERLHDVPVALVTGTNGKSTSVRLIGAIAMAAGRVPGVTSTDAITVGGERLAEGDYSGPNGARSVLRDRRVQVGVLEVARGGILRRGLAVARAQVALVTNVAADHLGEYGVFDLATLADVKMVVARAVVPAGRVVLNADDALLLERGRRLGTPVTWFTLDPAHPEVTAHLARGGDACLVEDGHLVFARGAERRRVVRLGEVPITFGGTALHNVANALGAMGVTMALGFGDEAIARGLTGFDGGPASNPGRTNVWRLGGVTAVVDYAHNPHGVRALAAMVARLPARRRGLVIGQAGDRDDDAIRDMVRAAWAISPDRVFIKEMESFLRGREAGVVPAVIEAELRRLGAPAPSISRHDEELEAVRAALEWAQDGDVVVLTTHAQREAVIELLEHLAGRSWKPGEPLAARDA